MDVAQTHGQLLGATRGLCSVTAQLGLGGTRGSELTGLSRGTKETRSHGASAPDPRGGTAWAVLQRGQEPRLLPCLCQEPAALPSRAL